MLKWSSNFRQARVNAYVLNLHCRKEGEQMHGGELLSHSPATKTAHCLVSQNISKKVTWKPCVLELHGGARTSNLKAGFPLPLFSFLVEVHLLGLWLPRTPWLCVPPGSPCRSSKSPQVPSTQGAGMTDSPPQSVPHKSSLVYGLSGHGFITMRVKRTIARVTLARKQGR